MDKFLAWRIERDPETDIVRHVAEWDAFRFLIVNWGCKVGCYLIIQVKVSKVSSSGIRHGWERVHEFKQWRVKDAKVSAERFVARLA